MRIEQAHELTSQQRSAIEALCADSYAPEGLSAPLWLSNEINYDRSIDCFFMAYENNDASAALASAATAGAAEAASAAGAAAAAPAAGVCNPAPAAGAAESRLVAFLTTFMPGPHEAEVTAFTHPGFRRRGYFAALLAAACQECIAHEIPSLLFAVESKSASGAAVLEAIGNTQLDHSEYRMELPLDCMEMAQDCTEPPFDCMGMTQDRTELPLDCMEMALDEAAPCLRFEILSEANLEDYNELLISALEEDGPRDEYASAALNNPQRRAVIAYLQETNRPVGVYHINIEYGFAFIYGVGVKVDLRGQGLGTVMLRHAVQQTREMGMPAALDVDSANAAARHIYSGLGFKTTLQVDYYRAPMPAGCCGPASAERIGSGCALHHEGTAI